MSPALRAVLFFGSVVLIDAIASGQAKTDDPLKPVTVCEILFSSPNFEGKNVAVLGRTYFNGGGRWLRVDDCGQKLVTEGYQWPNSVWLDCCEEVDPDIPNGALSVDHSALLEKITRLQKLNTSTFAWTVAFGRVETRQPLSKGNGFDRSNESPARLVIRTRLELNFDDNGKPIQIVEVCGNCPMITLDPSSPRMERQVMELPLQHSAIDPALLTPPVLALEQNPPDKPIKTTVCELLDNPQRFLDRLFEMRAELVGQSTLLHDPNCLGSVPVLLPEERSATKGKDYYKLKRYLGHPGVATATVVGTCAMRGNPHGGTFICEAQSVSDVRKVKAAK